MIDITKACTVAFIKARNSLVDRCRKKHVNWKKKEKMERIYFFKVLASRFWLTSKKLFNKFAHG